MPHKHTRRIKDESSFDLPPSQRAKPLPPTLSRKFDPKTSNPTKPEPTQATNPRKRKHNSQKTPRDDVPRAFKRLMAFADGRRPRSGLDDGTAPTTQSKKKKKVDRKPALEEDDVKHEADKANPPPAPTTTTKEAPKIRPGESMHEFSARVDAALPLSGLIAKSSTDPLGVQPRRTRKEKKMHRLYDEWHREEEKIKEKREDVEDERAEMALEEEMAGISWQGGDGNGTGKGKTKGKGKEEDIWAVLGKKAKKPGLNDVAKAAPVIRFDAKKLVRGAAVKVDGVPKVAGSLRKREELVGVREDLIGKYREMGKGRSVHQLGRIK